MTIPAKQSLPLFARHPLLLSLQLLQNGRSHDPQPAWATLLTAQLGRFALLGKLVVSATVEARRFSQWACTPPKVWKFPLDAVGTAVHSGQQGWLGLVQNGFSQNIAETVQAQAQDLSA
jgi:hypothetical protein